MMTTSASRGLSVRISNRFRHAIVAGLLALGLTTTAVPLYAEDTPPIIPLETISATAQQLHPGELLKVELERKQGHGREVYKVEILDPTEGSMWKLRLDARTGELLKQERETEHDHARRLHNEGAIVSLESVTRAAQGYRAGDLLEVELERKRGNYIYEVEILDAQGQVWELHFDARDGTFLKEEADN